MTPEAKKVVLKVLRAAKSNAVDNQLRWESWRKSAHKQSSDDQAAYKNACDETDKIINAIQEVELL